MQLLNFTTKMTFIQTDEVFSILTGKVSTAINRAVLRAFAAEGLDITTEQWTILACLWREDKVTQQTLSNITLKDKPSITRLIDNLEKRRLVTRVSDSSDRRINLIHLTSAGEALQTQATQIIQRISDQTLADVSEVELNTVREVLRKIMFNLK